MAVIRLGLIGCGYICKTHLKALKELNDPSIAVTALVDINKEAAESTKQLLPAPQNCQVKQYVEILPFLSPLGVWECTGSRG